MNTKSIGLLLCAGIFISCTELRRGNNGDTYLARVGSNYLTLEEAQKNISAFEYKQDSTEALTTYRRKWIQQQILLKEADNLELRNQPHVRKRLQQAQHEILLNALKEAIMSRYDSEAHVSDAEAMFYYKQNRNQLVLDERYVKFRHIKNREIAEIRRARNHLQNDSSWTEIARTFSLNPRESITASLNYWPVSSVFNGLPAIQNYASTLDSGQISPIQRYNGVYHLIQLTDVREQGERADPSWFIEELKSWLTREKRRRYYNSYVKNLYLKAQENNEIELFNVSKFNINDTTEFIDTTQENE